MVSLSSAIDEDASLWIEKQFSIAGTSLGRYRRIGEPVAVVALKVKESCRTLLRGISKPGFGLVLVDASLVDEEPSLIRAPVCSDRLEIFGI